MTGFSENPRRSSEEAIAVILARGQNPERRRTAWARYLADNRERIMKMVSARLEDADRRYFNTSDGFATVARNVDRMADHQRWRPKTEEQLWERLGEIVDDLVERRRLEGLARINAERDPGLAAYLADCMSEKGSIIEVVDARIGKLSNPHDQELLMLRLRGANCNAIAQITGSTPEAIRKRLSRLYERLKEMT